MSGTIKASVIIPTFNRQASLAAILTCLSHQTRSKDISYEVIVVDDGSTDTTHDFMSEAITSRQWSFTLRYFNTKLTSIFGTPIARNIGIKNACGNYFLFLDDDSLPHREWLMQHVQCLESGVAVAVGYISRNKHILNQNLPIAIEEKSMHRLQALSNDNNLTEFMSGNCALQRRCIERVGMFDERFACKDGYGYEDIEFGHRLLIGGFTLKFNPTAVVYSKDKPASVLRQREKAKQKAKLLWWHILTHPQENLPITPLLHKYAEEKKKELRIARQR